ncbi:hypothetical protein D9619_003764 [Psilocybe cf. subviscida]|uniref:Uncharacterized protein n=1 Tax=Psilocybe cf. subviscida TaxID=2480587 RepID=A0A8H5AW36_9AGAR|nr:hypothetical protein D9619_003764 [Psilocybe cf. subviscida]
MAHLHYIFTHHTTNPKPRTPSETMSILPNGVYLIRNGNNVASNFPATGTHPPFITAISFAGMSGPYSQWMVKHVDQGAYSITNLGSGFKAFVKDEEKGASVDGNSDKGVHFAIEPAGMNEYTIKTVDRDLDWTVNEEQPEFIRVFLEPSGKGVSQHFLFQFLRPFED